MSNTRTRHFYTLIVFEIEAYPMHFHIVWFQCRFADFDYSIKNNPFKSIIIFHCRWLSPEMKKQFYHNTVFFSELIRNIHIIIIIFRLHEKNKIDTTVKNKQDNHNEFLKYCTGPLHYTRQHSIVISRNRTEWGAKGLIWLGGPRRRWNIHWNGVQRSRNNMGH